MRLPFCNVNDCSPGFFLLNCRYWKEQAGPGYTLIEASIFINYLQLSSNMHSLPSCAGQLMKPNTDPSGEIFQRQFLILSLTDRGFICSSSTVPHWANFAHMAAIDTYLVSAHLYLLVHSTAIVELLHFTSLLVSRNNWNFLNQRHWARRDAYSKFALVRPFLSYPSQLLATVFINTSLVQLHISQFQKWQTFIPQ